MPDEREAGIPADKSSMTQGGLDEGCPVCLAGVATVRPSEFMIVGIG